MMDVVSLIGNSPRVHSLKVPQQNLTICWPIKFNESCTRELLARLQLSFDWMVSAPSQN